MDIWQWILILVVIAATGALAFVAGAGWARGQERATTARLTAERDLLAQRLTSAERDVEDERRVAAELAPLRHTLVRVEEQIRQLERDRAEQFGQVGDRLAHVADHTAALRDSTARLAGALNSSGVRGTWGETQLRRLLEHAGMLAKADFDEQVQGVSEHDARVRPDVVVRLPGDACLVIDAKAPLTAFLQAQADDIGTDERGQLLRQHAKSLRGHVDALAGKAYWSAFSTTPEMVVCFVPSDAVLAAALQADPSLYEDAQARKVVLASPATLLALLRAVAFGWQQQALTTSARDLLALGVELHQRLSTLGRHVGSLGTTLKRAVEGYNAMVGSLESRVLVTSRRLHDLGIAPERLDELLSVTETPRSLTAPELIDGLTSDNAKDSRESETQTQSGTQTELWTESRPR